MYYQKHIAEKRNYICSFYQWTEMMLQSQLEQMWVLIRVYSWQTLRTCAKRKHSENIILLSILIYCYQKHSFRHLSAPVMYAESAAKLKCAHMDQFKFDLATWFEKAINNTRSFPMWWRRWWWREDADNDDNDNIDNEINDEDGDDDHDYDDDYSDVTCTNRIQTLEMSPLT